MSENTTTPTRTRDDWAPAWQADLAGEQQAWEAEQNSVGGYSVPVDPMDLLQCDSCQ